MYEDFFLKLASVSEKSRNFAIGFCRNYEIFN